MDKLRMPEKDGVPLLDIELICRCIIGHKYAQHSKWADNSIIAILNSSTLDTDKLDYLMRDAYMTGVSVPPIEISRLFKNILINPVTKTITYNHNALPVIQNIIDSRDSLYLWVYNHHTTVYTDFIVEFYIKHLIANNESKTPNQFIDRIDPTNFFSCNAITDKLASDSDLWSTLKSWQTQLTSEDVSKYTKHICPQLFERQFLKPIWKTIYEFNHFITNNVQDEGLRNTLIHKMCDSNHIYRAHVVRLILDACNLKHGQVFIVPRSNKFYSLKNEFFPVYINGNDIDVRKLLPQRDFRELPYSDVAFYVFCPDGLQTEVKNVFSDIISKPLPDASELTEATTKIEWLC
jgi:HD superfamily phosphohydrolase